MAENDDQPDKPDLEVPSLGTSRIKIKDIGFIIINLSFTQSFTIDNPENNCHLFPNPSAAGRADGWMSCAATPCYGKLLASTCLDDQRWDGDVRRGKLRDILGYLMFILGYIGILMGRSYYP